ATNGRARGVVVARSTHASEDDEQITSPLAQSAGGDDGQVDDGEVRACVATDRPIVPARFACAVGPAAAAFGVIARTRAVVVGVERVFWGRIRDGWRRGRRRCACTGE